MPLPLIPVLIGGAAVAIAGKGLKCAWDWKQTTKEARNCIENANKKAVDANNKLESERGKLQSAAEQYTQFLLQCQSKTFKHFSDFVEGLGQHAKLGAFEILEDVEISKIEFKQYAIAAIEAKDILGGTAAATTASAAATTGVGSLVGAFGTASTGTAISGLSGAAATSATLAWLGGGSLAAGGGGVFVGTIILGGVTIAPGILVGGMVLKSRGEKALKDAINKEKEIHTEIAKVEKVVLTLRSICHRVGELQQLIQRINRRAVSALDQLDSSTFNIDHDYDVERFQRVAILVKALAEIMRTPILDDDGNITDDSIQVYAKYRTLGD